MEDKLLAIISLCIFLLVVLIFVVLIQRTLIKESEKNRSSCVEIIKEQRDKLISISKTADILKINSRSKDNLIIKLQQEVDRYNKNICTRKYNLNVYYKNIGEMQFGFEFSDREFAEVRMAIHNWNLDKSYGLMIYDEYGNMAELTPQDLLFVKISRQE